MLIVYPGGDEIMNPAITRYSVWLLTLILILPGLSGCYKTSNIPDEDETEQSTQAADNLEGETTQSLPQWPNTSFPLREFSMEPLSLSDRYDDWYSTNEMDEVIEASLESGKSIFCFINRRNEHVSWEIERQFLGSDEWRELLGEYFILCEVNIWENPTLALHLLNGAGSSEDRITTPKAPAIAILRVTDDPEPEISSAIDLWPGFAFTVYSCFPFHETDTGDDCPSEEMYYQPDDERVHGELQRLSQAEGIPFVCLPEEEISASEAYRDIREWYTRYETDPEVIGRNGIPFCMWLRFRELSEWIEIEDAEKEIDSWTGELNYLTLDIYATRLLLRPGLYDYLQGGFLTTDVTISNTLQMIQCAADQGVAYPTPPQDVFREVQTIVSFDESSMQRGIPAYLDWIESNAQHLDEYNSVAEPVTVSRPQYQPLQGPTDIAWVNAKVMSEWLELVMTHPELGKIELDDGSTVNEYLDRLAPVLLSTVEEWIEAGPSEYNLTNNIWLLSLYNTLYMRNGDVELLEKAADIAEIYSPATSDEWFDPCVPLQYAHLPVSLHQYACLSGNADVERAAQFICDLTLESLGWPEYDTDEQEDLLLNYEIVNSSCIRIGVVSSLDDELGWDLLYAAQEGWDPRKVTQILDPVRDSDLIESLGFESSSEPIAYVAIDDEIYSQTNDPNELREIIDEVQDVLVERNVE